MVRPVPLSDWYQPPAYPANWSEAGWLERGLRYYQQVQSLLPHPARVVDISADVDSAAWRQHLLWIGQNVHRLNQHLWQLTQSCYDCFLSTCPAVQPWAFPLGPVLQADSQLVGICNLKTVPIALIVDVGQIHPSDWLGVVAHEFAHAVSGAGHGPDFQSALTHLCIGLGLPPPLTLSDSRTLQQWPPYHPAAQDDFGVGSRSIWPQI